MRIVDIKTYPMSYVDHRQRQLNYLLLRIDTDAGVSGYGEVCDGYGCSHPSSTAEIIREILLPIVIEEDPRDVGRLCFKMRGWTRRRLGDGGMIIQAISGVEIALWDIAGRARGVPISQLLDGRRRAAVRIYASGPFLDMGDADWQAQLFEPCFSRGVDAIKVRTGLKYREDIETLSHLRRLIGREVRIGIDGSEHYALSSALELARMLAEVGVCFFEEPLPQHNLRGMARLVATSPVPIAYGEHCFTVYGFRELIAHKAADIFQPDAATVGGILEAKKVCELAESFGITVIPHCAAGPVAFAANLHLCASIPNLSMLEYPFTLDAFWREILIEPIFSANQIEDGAIAVPAAPGLGIELNESAVEKYPYRAQGPVRGMPTWHLGSV